MTWKDVAMIVGNNTVVVVADLSSSLTDVVDTDNWKTQLVQLVPNTVADGV